MTSLGKISPACRALSLAALISLFSAGVVAQDQAAKKSGPEASANHPQDSPEVLDQLPEGELLPDMPEPGMDYSPQTSSSRQDTGPGASTNYLIGAEDILEIEVFNVPELKRTVRVANDGMIDLTLIGRVKASGLTVDQLRDQLESKYGETYLQDPHIAVFISEYHARSVSVIGAVEKPGLYQLTAPRNLIEVLSMAGGLAKRSSAPAGRTLIVTRKSGFDDVPTVEGMESLAPDKLQIDLRKLLYSRDSALNIEVMPRDTISVTKADLVYVVGDVRKPTGILMEDREGLTVLQALAMAEGVNRTASKGKSRIFRKDEDGAKTEIPVNLKEIFKGKAPDIPLVANDILYVPDSTSKVLLQRGAEAAIATVSGLIIWRR